jgi:nitric oxide dioxygenase
VLASRIERITQKHCGLNMLPEHYHFVAESLLGAIKEVLGEAATEEVLVAWGEAYWFLPDVLMAREASIYSRLAAAPGGWSGSRDFVIGSTKAESEVIRSFLLVPKDGRGVMRHQPGQYLTFALELPGREPLKRNYSISSGPGDRSYRISVKREARPGVPPGIVFNWLHDQAGPGTVLKVAPPAGEFSLNEKEDNPVVLVSSGVGLTLMVSMLEHVVHSGSGRPLWYVHGAENGRVHAMGMHERELAAHARNVTVRTFYNVPDPGDQAGRDYDERGLIHRQLARPQHADRGGRVLPLRPAAVPARDGLRPGAHRPGAQPHPLRVLRSRRRAAGGLKRGHGQSHNTLTYQISAVSAKKKSTRSGFS